MLDYETYVRKAHLRKGRSKTPSLLLSLRRATASRCLQRNPPHSRQQPSWPCPCHPPSSSGPLAPCAAHPSSSSRWRSGPPPAHRTTHLSPIVGPDSTFTFCTPHNTSFPYCGAWLSLHLHITQHIFPLLWGLTQPSRPTQCTTHLSPTVGRDSAFTCTTHLSTTVGPDLAFTCTPLNTPFNYCGAWLSLHLLWGLTQLSPNSAVTYCGA